jgi:hypothetical protein
MFFITSTYYHRITDKTDSRTNILQQKIRRKGGFSEIVDCTYKPNSVSAEADDSHLSGIVVTNYLVRLSEHLSENINFQSKVLGTALHSGKDLAVSARCHQRDHLRRGPLAFASGVSARTSMIAHDGRYPLPCSKHPLWETMFPSERCLGMFGLSSKHIHAQ